jgi:hypothetical protein
MATFLQWYGRHTKGELKRVYWVCGPVRRLVEEVVDSVRERVDADPYDSVSLTAGETSDRDIWAEFNLFSTEARRRFILVREAERIQKWGPFLDWFSSKELPRTYGVFVSSAYDTDRTTDWMQAIVKKGRYTRCGPFSLERERVSDAVKVLQLHHRNLLAPEANYLFQRVRGDMEAALEALEKASYFRGEMSRAVIDALAEAKPSDRYVAALIAGRKVEAFEAARSMPEEDFSKTIGLLDSRLDALTRVGAIMRRDPRATIQKLCSSTGLPAVTVVDIRLAAASYDRKRIRRCSETLAFVDSAQATGQDGLMEVLTSLW